MSRDQIAKKKERLGAMARALQPLWEECYFLAMIQMAWTSPGI